MTQKNADRADNPMQQLIILKTGSTLPELLARKGDFTDWISAGLDAGPTPIRIVDAQNGCELPAYEDVAGVVITGSHDMVSHRLPWSERAAAWLPGLVSAASQPSASATAINCWPTRWAARWATTPTAANSAR